MSAQAGLAAQPNHSPDQSRALLRSPAQCLRHGFLQALPFILVLLPFGMLFGVVATDAGLDLPQILGFTVLVLAGASADAADAEGRRPRDICLHGGKYLQSALEDAEKDRAARVQAAAATLQNNITLPRAPVIRPRRLQGPARR